MMEADGGVAAGFQDIGRDEWTQDREGPTRSRRLSRMVMQRAQMREK